MLMISFVFSLWIINELHKGEFENLAMWSHFQTMQLTQLPFALESFLQNISHLQGNHRHSTNNKTFDWTFFCRSNLSFFVTRCCLWTMFCLLQKLSHWLCSGLRHTSDTDLQPHSAISEKRKYTPIYQQVNVRMFAWLVAALWRQTCCKVVNRIVTS